MTSAVTPDLHTSVALTSEPLSVDRVLALAQDPRAGAVVLFVGTIREHDGGREGVVEVDYSAHPDAEATLGRLAEQAGHRPGVRAVVLHHRTGALRVGEVAVVCAVAAEHRPEAFETAREVIEQLKQTVPIWKHQSFSDGATEWVGL